MSTFKLNLGAQIYKNKIMEQNNSCKLNVTWQKTFLVFTSNLWKEIIKDKITYLYFLVSAVLISASSVYLPPPIKYSSTIYPRIFYITNLSRDYFGLLLKF